MISTAIRNYKAYITRKANPSFISPGTVWIGKIATATVIDSIAIGIMAQTTYNPIVLHDACVKKSQEKAGKP